MLNIPGIIKAFEGDQISLYLQGQQLETTRKDGIYQAIVEPLTTKKAVINSAWVDLAIVTLKYSQVLIIVDEAKIEYVADSHLHKLHIRGREMLKDNDLRWTIVPPRYPG